MTLRLLSDTLRHEHNFDRLLAWVGARLLMGIEDLEILCRCGVLSQADYFRLQEAGII